MIDIDLFDVIFFVSFVFFSSFITFILVGSKELISLYLLWLICKHQCPAKFHLMQKFPCPLDEYQKGKGKSLHHDLQIFLVPFHS